MATAFPECPCCFRESSDIVEGQCPTCRGASPDVVASDCRVMAHETTALEQNIVDLLNAVKGMFRSPMRMTLLARDPTEPEADVIVTDDDLDEVLAAIQRRKGEGS